ncbi:ABC transporter substrate-binding protein [Aurantivibrio plasticivorans]
MSSLALSENRLTVLYPEIRDPYRQIFMHMIEGIEEASSIPVIAHELARGETEQTVGELISQGSNAGVIALGKRSIDALGKQQSIPIIMGAAILKPDTSHYIGITLNPDPSQVFGLAVELQPNLKNIYVVYNPSLSDWTIQQAAKQAKALGLTLHTYPVDSMQDAAMAYRTIQESMNSDTDGLWLPIGAPSRDKSILQRILETAWAKNQMVFSSNLSDVKRGALFALYPNNFGMGKDLVRLLETASTSEIEKNHIAFSTSLNKAVNRRAAEHLGIRLTKNDLEAYEFVYPSK